MRKKKSPEVSVQKSNIQLAETTQIVEILCRFALWIFFGGATSDNSEQASLLVLSRLKFVFHEKHYLSGEFAVRFAATKACSRNVMRNVIETIVSEMKKLEKNYLRIYGNLNQSVYSDDEKKVFLESLLNIAFDVFNHKNLRFDISGSGYGISKGDNLLSEKAFQNKLLKKGFTNLNGITIHSSDHTYKSGFDLFTNPNLLNRIDIYFSWPLILNLDKSIDILEKISNSIKLDYAYAYQADNTLSESGEWKVTSSLFSTTATFPKQEQKWEEQMQNIKTGFVKKLYPINAFNPKQIENLNFLSPIKKIKLKDKNEIWVFDDKLVDIQNAKIATKVL